MKKYQYHKKRHGKRKDKYNSAKETPHHIAYGKLKNYKQPSRKKEKLVCLNIRLKCSCR